MPGVPLPRSLQTAAWQGECAVGAGLGPGAVSSAHYTPTCGLTPLGLGLLGTESLNTFISVLKFLTFKHPD